MAMERYLSTDVLAEIMKRLPPSSRCRARLVCRHWRDVVNEHTTEMQSRPKVLLWNVNYAVAYVSDNLSSTATGNSTQIWRTSDPWRHEFKGIQLVGTCNGLICLCDNTKIKGGAITLFNPTTGEKLDVPPPPRVGYHGGQKWGDAYSFAYHPITGQYKLVHIPGSYKGVYELDVVYVRTLGEATWWKVPVGPGNATCNLAAGIISVDGTTYWVKVTSDNTTRIVAFDLMTECATSTTRKPAPHDHYRLTEVHGRLGFIAWPYVWVREGGQRWTRRYNFKEDIPWPHFVYGECVLMCKGLSYYGHRPEVKLLSGWRLLCDNVMRIGHQDEGTLVAKMKREGRKGYYETFAYVETTEPLSIYTQ